MKSFTDKTAVITGGAGGIGYALAEVCGRQSKQPLKIAKHMNYPLE
jgi:NAD(P)-dependent dehydrogenase (short-subunit alcohol dehydrogenase family)